MFPKKLLHKLSERKKNNAFRYLKSQSECVDFASNDYLGFASSEIIFNKTHQKLLNKNTKINGATGSRLLTGNHYLYTQTENFLATFHQAESALLFNSGYDANLGFFATIPQRNDIILYDELSHASIRDGIQLSNAKSFKFKHNNIDDLLQLLTRCRENQTLSEIYVVTESVFSMDGDTPNLKKLALVCKKHKAFLIVDEAHAIGVFNSGLIQQLQLQNEVFARIITFGKALGCHGAVVLGSKKLISYLVNFARSFIYTTGLSPHSVATIFEAYQFLNSQNGIEQIKKLQQNRFHFINEIQRLSLSFILSKSSIHCCIVGGNNKTIQIANQLQQNGFDIKPILSPTVEKGKERLRFCLHSYNSFNEISEVLSLLKKFQNKNYY